MNTRAFALLPVLLVVSLLGFAAYVVKPSALPGTAAHRAAVSEKTTAALVAADDKRAATAAASVAKIAEANGDAPESPTKAFISQESTLALAHLPTPDATALVEAEKRKVAVMSGQLDEARRLYAAAGARADQLTRERDAALAAKQRSDAALATAAAAEHAAGVQRLVFAAVALLCAGLWIYSRVYGIGPSALGAIAADIRQGVNPIQAMDTHLAPWLHPKVAAAAKVATPLPSA